MGILDSLFDPANNAGIPPGVEVELEPESGKDEWAGEYDESQTELETPPIELGQRFRLLIPRPLPVIPGLGKILDAHTYTIEAATRAPIRIGITDQPAGAQLAYMLLYATGGSFSIAGDMGALPGARATFPSGLGLNLPHVGMCYAWGDAATTVTLAVLVIGL